MNSLLALIAASGTTTVLVAVIASAASGFGGVLWGARNDRRERRRDRLIEAADDLSVAFGESLVSTLTAIGIASGDVSGQLVPAHTEARAKRDAALIRSARVDLLFGTDSDTFESAANALNHLAKANNALAKTPPDAVDARTNHSTAAEHFVAFQRHALASIKEAKW